MFDFLKRLLGRVDQDPSCERESPAFRFVGRICEPDIRLLASRALGRPLTRAERDSIREGFRPWGLLAADDGYEIRVCSPNYLGMKPVPVITILSAVADGGYIEGEILRLTECAELEHRDEFGQACLVSFTAPVAA